MDLVVENSDWIPSQKKLEWFTPQILEMRTALTDGKSYSGIEASALEPPGPS